MTTTEQRLAVTSEVASDCLKKIFKLYPSYGEHVHKYKVFQVWVSLLENLNCCDLDAVVGEILSGDREPTSRYEKAERLPLNIVEECRLRAGRRNLKEEQERKYHSPSRGAMAFVRRSEVGHLAITLGQEVKDGYMDSETSSQRTLELLAWEKAGGERPEWIDEMVEARASRKEKREHTNTTPNMSTWFSVVRLDA